MNRLEEIINPRGALSLFAMLVAAGCGDPAVDEQPPPEDTLANWFIPECTPDTCQNGGTCNEEPFGFRCTCPAGFSGDRCQTANPPQPGRAGFYAPCTANEDCATGLCWGGACSARCSDDATCRTAPAGSIAIATCMPGFWVCALVDCYSDADCTPGQRCVSAGGPFPAFGKACSP